MQYLLKLPSDRIYIKGRIGLTIIQRHQQRSFFELIDRQVWHQLFLVVKPELELVKHRL